MTRLQSKPHTQDPGHAAVRGVPRAQPARWTRRTVLGLLGAGALLSPVGAHGGAVLVRRGSNAQPDYALYHQAVGTVLPWAGYISRIALGDCIVRCVSEGALDRDKYVALWGGADSVPTSWLALLDQRADEPLHLTTGNAANLVDLLWPVGLSNHVAANSKSPIAGPDVDTFASTGGWNLGTGDSGGQYFDKFAIVDLTSAQEALAVRVAEATFRPCCDNSTFFQDCNHGSALFAVLQLGAAQGLDEDALYREALAFNSYWFPDTYVATALYLKAIHKVDWRHVDPKQIMGADYSTASGWDKNVWQPLQAHPDLFPSPSNNVNCGA